MKIDNPTQLAELTSKYDETVKALEEANKKAETATAELEAKNLALTEATNITTALTEENKTLKESLGTLTSEKEELVGKVTELTSNLEAETAKSKELEASVEQSKTDLAAKDEEIVKLNKGIDDLVNLCVDAEESKEAITNQFELIAAHLNPKGAQPDLEEVNFSETQPESNKLHAEWVRMSNSTDPKERITARKFYNLNKAEIDKAIVGKTPANTALGTKGSVELSAEDQTIFGKYKGLRQEAANAANSNIPSIHALHATKIVEARKFYNANKAVLDKCIAASVAA